MQHHNKALQPHCHRPCPQLQLVPMLLAYVLYMLLLVLMHVLRMLLLLLCVHVLSACA
jgi:hypothetical protein